MKSHILIVEDEDRLRAFLAGVLSNLGYFVTQAADGDIALSMLEHAATSETPYEVIISDIVMGNVDGIQLLKVANQQPYRPEVILLTGKASVETAVEAVRAGAFDYLLKPCLIAKIVERVEAALAHRQDQLLKDRAVQTLRTIASVTHTTLDAPQHPVASSAPLDTPQQEPIVASRERSLIIGSLRIDIGRHEVWMAERPVSLTPTEFAVLMCLAATPEQVVPFSDIAMYAYNRRIKREEARKMIAPHIHKLRLKLDRRCIVSVPRVGYMFITPD